VFTACTAVYEVTLYASAYISCSKKLTLHCSRAVFFQGIVTELLLAFVCIFCAHGENKAFMLAYKVPSYRVRT
jgi:hypothetical protein